MDKEDHLLSLSLHDFLNALLNDEVKNVKKERESGENIYVINMEFHFEEEKNLMYNDIIYDMPYYLGKFGDNERVLKIRTTYKLAKRYMGLLYPCHVNDKIALRPIVKKLGRCKTLKRDNEKIDVVEVFVYESIIKEIQRNKEDNIWN